MSWLYVLLSRQFFWRVSPLRAEKRGHGYPTDDYQSKRKHRTCPPKPFARSFTHSDAPLRAKKVYPISKVPRGSNDSDQIKHSGPPVLKLSLHLAKGCIGMREQVCTGEAHSVGMPDDVGEGDSAGPALRGIHKVSRPGIVANVGLAAEPDIEAVERVIQKRNI